MKFTYSDSHLNTDRAQLVQMRLLEKGIETPFMQNRISTSQKEKEEKKEQLAIHFKAIFELIGLDLTHGSVQKTPERMAKSYLDFVSGLDYHNFPEITLMQNIDSTHQMILVQDIAFISMCEHHFVPIDGKVSIAYLPNQTIIGFSKVIEIVHFFAARPQLQERLTQQIVLALQTILETEDIAIVVQATHYCAKMKPAQADNVFKTSHLAGQFKTDVMLNNQFFQFIK